MSRIQRHFICFGRNGRWGVCADCPCDSLGMLYPEFCKYTDRYDHNLGFEQLAERYRLMEELAYRDGKDKRIAFLWDF